ncbi:U2 snRNP component IST3 [Tirmania nivea]|nr:U2 snRNP component IST3 [Tirmania nivea]
MNTIRSITALNQRELEAGTSDAASWHADYADTAYIYIGGLPYELSEGDIISIFSQYGEPVHCNLIRDKETGKSRGFAFLKYEDQRSTNLAVDNFSGANILGRKISVDHHRYKHKEDEEKAEAEAKEEATQAAAGGQISPRDRDEDSRRQRKWDAEEEAEPRRKHTKKEMELVKLMRDIDEEDPMKEYMIQQKKDEVEAEKALIRSKKKRGHKDKDHHRHRHRHRSRSRSPRRHRSCSRGEPARDMRRRRSKEREGAHGRDRSRDHRYPSRR